jgi:predicted dehydrogenase
MGHGLDVLCEKPAAVRASQAEAMIRTAERTGRTLTFMFNQRTNGCYRALKKLLQSGRLGSLKRINWIVTDWYRTQRYYDSGSWRATWAGEGGGVLLNQCPHQLDLLIWLFGMPDTVTAKCQEGKWHTIEVEDDVTAFFEFPCGATGVFVTSTGDLPGTNRLEIDCERGKVVCEDGEIRIRELKENERDICFTSDDPWYRGEMQDYLLETDSGNPQHAGVINAFAAHLLRGEPLTAKAEDGLRELELSNAIHLSGWTGETLRIPVSKERFDGELDKRIAGSRNTKTGDITYETNHNGTGARLSGPDHTS